MTMLHAYFPEVIIQKRYRIQTDTEKPVDKDFANMCNWFVENKPSIHFGVDNTKSILLASKRKV